MLEAKAPIDRDNPAGIQGISVVLCWKNNSSPEPGLRGLPLAARRLPASVIAAGVATCDHHGIVTIRTGSLQPARVVVPEPVLLRAQVVEVVP